MNPSDIKLSNIQKGLYQFFVEGLDTIVENQIDLDTPKPYIAMGDLRTRREHARGLEGLEITQELLVFSNFKGKDEVINIVDDIRELISEYEVEIDGVNVHDQYADDAVISQFDVAVYEGQLSIKLMLFNY